MQNSELQRLIQSLAKKIYNSAYIESLKEYFESIQFLADKHLNLEFNNKDHNHAILVMSMLFEKAEQHIRIFAKRFSGEISDDEYYLKTLKEAIDRGVKVDVVFEEQPNQKSIALQMLKAYPESKVNLYILNDDYKQKLKKELGELQNFSVVDDSKFRYETDTLKFKAFCNFDDKDNCEILINNYLKLVSNATKI